MKPFIPFALLCGLLFGLSPVSAQTQNSRALTIYNQNFSVVRETIPLTLKEGVNHLAFSDITYHLEPDSVVLRDPAGKRALQILEQNYRADPISQELLLSLYEGKTIDFVVTHPDRPSEIVRGKIIRSGYVPHTAAFAQYGQQYYASQQGYAYGGGGQPIIEVDGKLQFTLPGLPQFPALGDDTILKPTLDWTLETDKAGPLNAELAYITGGMSWKADYNLVAPESGEGLDLVGWVTMDNQSGKSFENARIKLMAGDVSKVHTSSYGDESRALGSLFRSTDALPPPVTEKAFDDYHLYTLERPATLRDRETKQVEFVRATGIKSHSLYLYDGADLSAYENGGYNAERTQSYGTQSNSKVWVMREFANTLANGLGIPLPKGRMRFYRRDADGQLEFTGENTIDHTPKNETVRVYTGNAFDLVGERRQTDTKLDTSGRIIDETFEIKIRNHKATPAEVRIVEHLYRGLNWAITAKSTPFVKTNAATVEFRVPLAPDEERTVTYTVHYTW